MSVMADYGERPSRYTPVPYRCNGCDGEMGYLWHGDEYREARDDYVCFGRVESSKRPGVMVDCLYSYAERKARREREATRVREKEPGFWHKLIFGKPLPY